MSTTFQCPYCQVMTFKDERNAKTSKVNLFKSVIGNSRLLVVENLCGNPTCRKLSLKTELHKVEYYPNGSEKSTQFNQAWSLLPASKAKPQPDYIPAAIVQDYQEACAIVEMSPKASATLSRRCIQGMIRDFHAVKGRTLFDEIDAISDKIDPEVKASIDAVRNIGNIGAHMEKDIDLIIDVEPHEAETLIALIEQLLNEWYGNRHRRQETMKAIQATALGKAALKDSAKTIAQIEKQEEPTIPA